MTNVDCPDCGRRVELNQSGIIPHHDNGSPIVCAGSGRLATAVERRAMCEWCNSPATCIATSEDDPYQFACDEHCGHGDEEGAHAFLSEPAAMLAIINGLHARVAALKESAALARAEEREACADIAKTLADSAYEMGESELRAAPQQIASAIRARSKDGAR